MTDDEDDFVQQALRADIEKECRVLGETPKPQNVLRALHLCFKYDLEQSFLLELWCNRR